MSHFVHLLIFIVVAVFAFDGALAQGDRQQTGSITGRVTIDGRGAPDFVISLAPIISIGVHRQKPIETRTDGAGYFRLTNVPTTDWLVMLREPTQERIYAFSNRSEPLYWGIRVTVPPGGVAERIDFALTRGAVITGKALDERGQPVTDGWVTCLWFDSRVASQPELRNVIKTSEYGFGWRMMWEPVRTDERGAYRFSGLSAGAYRVVFEHKDKGKYLNTFYPNATDETKAATIELRAGAEAANIDVRLSPRPKFAVSGRMIDAQTNQPLPNLSWGYYQMIDHGQETARLNDFVGYSGAQGEIQVDNLLPGKYVAYIGKAESARDLYCDPAIFEIRDDDVTNVEIKVYRGASISGRAVIEWTTDPATLAKLTDLRLGVLNFSSSPSVFTPFYPSAQIAADGSFRLSALRPGKLRIQPENFPKGFTLWSVERNGREQQDWVFDLAAGEQLSGVRVVIAHSAGAIRGQIKAEGETSFSGRWMVFLKGVRGAPTLGFMNAVDGQGHFVLDGLAPGTYTVSVARFGRSEGNSPFEDGAHGEQTVTVSNGKETPVTIIVNRGAKDKHER